MSPRVQGYRGQPDQQADQGRRQKDCGFPVRLNGGIFSRLVSRLRSLGLRRLTLLSLVPVLRTTKWIGHLPLCLVRDAAVLLHGFLRLLCLAAAFRHWSAVLLGEVIASAFRLGSWGLGRH